MEQNKFEKDIQRKLDELKMHPSEAVWQNVEKRIVVKKTRRKGILVLFFLSLFLLTGGYWWSHLKDFDQSSKQKTLLRTDPAQKTKDSVTDKIFIENSGIAKPSSQKANNVSSTILPYTNRLGEKSKSRKSIFLNKGNLIANIANGSSPEDQHVITANEKIGKLQNDLSRETPDLAIKKDEKMEQLLKDEKNDSALTESMRQHDVATNALEKKDTSFPSPAKESSASNKRKWHPGITLSGGTSLIGNEFLNGSNNVYSDYLSSAPGTGSGTGNSSFFYSSSVRSSFAFIAGFFIEKNVSVNHKISIGINYKYFSTLNKVGYKIDSAQTAYNFSTTATAAGDHRNEFNYLDLPVTLTFRISKAKAFPLFWHAGISISELIYSNALQFKSVPGIYYIDNSFFNKTQIGFNTGLSTTLFSGQRTSLQIGPYFYYSASRLTDKGMYNKKHFSFVGISTQLVFDKK